MRKVYVLPNLFTTASVFCGLMAILNVFNVVEAPALDTHRFVQSCWLILAAAVLDLMDGLVARMTRTESLFGAQYDSLADVVAFGVAPAALVYTRLLSLENRQLAELIAITFPICGALRLARFNVQKTKVEKKSFTGLPIPAAAGVVVSGFLFFQKIDPDWDAAISLWGAIKFEASGVLSALTLLCSMLMVSTLSYPSFKQLNLERRRTFDILPVIVFLAAATMFFKNHLESIVFLCFVIYVGIGLAGGLAELFRGARNGGSRGGGPRGGGHGHHHHGHAQHRAHSVPHGNEPQPAEQHGAGDGPREERTSGGAFA